MSFRPDITSEPSRTNLFFPRPQYMTLPEQQLDFNAGNIPSVMPQRGSSQVSEQQGIQTSTVASKASGKKPRERWSNEEHERFLEGLKMYNRDWKSIEKHVGTKTAVQIRSHAQKFFVKAEREPGTVDFELPPPRPKRKPASAANGNASKSAVSQAQTDAAPAVKASVPPPSGGPIPTTNATALLGGLLPDTVSGPMQSLTGSTQLMNKIAAAAIAAATTTAHAVITAAGPEYLQVIQELAKHDQRLSFLACPLPELVSSFSRQPDGAERPSSKQLQTSEAPTSACPMSMPMKGGLGLTSIVNPSLPQPCMSEPPVQILNQLLSLPASSSQLISEQLGPELAQHRERLDMYGTVPSTTGMTGNMLLSHLNDSSTPEAATNTAPPLTTFTVPPPALPHINLPAPMLATGNKAQGPPYSAVEQPLHAVSMPVPSPPVSGQVQSMQHATPVPQNSSAHATMPWHAVQLLQTQQQNQQHVFPKPGGLQAEELPATTTGYGQQGSGGGSGGNSGGEMNGSGDKSGSKSAKQSGNVKAPEMLEVLPCGNEGQAPECLPLGAVNDMPLLQPQGRLNSMQRAEFYKQYYHEMIRRGTEGLRNMNVDLGSDNMAWLGPDGAPMAGLPTPDSQPMNANKSPPGAELPASRRQECLPEAHGWTGRKKQRTADTLDLQKAALSNACEQPAAILGMVPCPPDASILPLESGRVLEFHKGTGWAIEVEQQDTATSAQGHSREGPGASRNTHPDTSHKLQTSPQKAHPEVSQGKDGPPPCRNRPNSSGEGSNEPGEGCNEPGEGCNDGSGDGAKPEPGDANADDPALPEKGGEEFKQESTRSLMHHRVQRTTGA